MGQDVTLRIYGEYIYIYIASSANPEADMFLHETKLRSKLEEYFTPTGLESLGVSIHPFKISRNTNIEGDAGDWT